jgi:cytochrome P450
MMNPPGPKGKPLVGSLPELRNQRLQFLVSNRERYGDVVFINGGPRRLYQLNNPDDIQYVLVKAPHKFHKSPNLKAVTGPILGQGLLTSDGEFHRQQRKLIQPAFHHQRISRYADVMVDYTARMLTDWQDGAAFDVHDEMMRLTMAIVAKTLFDADVSHDADSIGEAIGFAIADASARMTQLAQLPLWVPTRGNQMRRRNRDIIERTIRSMIEERRASGEDRGDLLSMLLLAQDEVSGAGMSNQQVRDEAMTLFIAGHETTANALTWALYLLSQHPEVEARLQAELDSVLGERLPTMSDLRALSYTDQVIKEAMRLYPPAWLVTRLAIEDVTVGAYTISKGIVIMSQYVMHHHPAYWDAPDEFRPERFSPGWEDRVPKFAYFPFGGGPRICIGNSFAAMEAVLVLATIMQRWTFRIAPSHAVEMEPLITLRPRGGMPMFARQRERITA